jgi:hypothetical protein
MPLSVLKEGPPPSAEDYGSNNENTYRRLLSSVSDPKRVEQQYIDEQAQIFYRGRDERTMKENIKKFLIAAGIAATALLINKVYNDAINGQMGGNPHYSRRLRRKTKGNRKTKSNRK